MRARNIKPGIFKNELLGVEDPLLTIIFMGLWCAADKEGRIEDRPLRLKAEILPYRENLDFNGYLTELSRLDFIHRYEVNNTPYIQINNFKKHQRPHHTEKDSEIPEPPEITNGCDATVNSPLKDGENPPDLLIPDSLIPDSNIFRQPGEMNFTPEIQKLVNDFIFYVEKEKPKLGPKKTDSLIKKSCGAIDKLIRIDGFTLEYIARVLTWASKDSFWSDNLLSLSPLRTKKAGDITKFQKIASAYEKNLKTSGNTHIDNNKAAVEAFLNG